MTVVWFLFAILSYDDVRQGDHDGQWQAAKSTGGRSPRARRTKSTGKQKEKEQIRTCNAVNQMIHDDRKCYHKLLRNGWICRDEMHPWIWVEEKRIKPCYILHCTYKNAYQSNIIRYADIWQWDGSILKRQQVMSRGRRQKLTNTKTILMRSIKISIMPTRHEQL